MQQESFNFFPFSLKIYFSFNNMRAKIRIRIGIVFVKGYRKLMKIQLACR